MDEFLSTILGFPTVVFTVALGVVAGYWLLVIVGAVGSDMLDGTAGKLEGAVSAKVEGAADAVAAKVDGAVDAAAGKIEAGAAAGAGALSALGFGKMPATVVISLLALVAWAVSAIGGLWLGRLGLAGPLVGAAVAVAAVFVGGAVTGLVARAFVRAAPAHRPVRKSELVGRVAAVTTGRVDERFGQATLNVDGADVLVEVRCDTPNALARHIQVVLVSYDAEHHVYTVEAYEESAQRVAGGKDGPPRP